jgi:hypothetical protein
MTTKSDYTAEEWQTIFTAAPMVGLAVTAASPNGPFGVMKEMFSVGMAIGDTLQKGTSNPLISALIEDMKARGTKPDRPQGISTPEDAQKLALDSLRKLNQILATKSTPQEAAEFKQWLGGIGRRVAEASNEGGFLGFGGARVSAQEEAALKSIAGALGVEGKA